ncbi:MAG TPA: hypothetical protein VFN08_18530 [Gemmatimonadales bacterium]|jgi:hypothetical protein|nr:hypothetical protein [Gemmatimonadales bacterium]
MTQTPHTTPEKKALLEAFDTVLKTQAEEREARRAEAAARARHGTSRLIMVLSTSVLVFVSVYLYVERPDWVFPAPPTPESLVVREASLRITVANAAQHIERFRNRTGRLPATLGEAGAHESNLDYEPANTVYKLLADTGGVRVTYDSGQPLTQFVGNSFKIISRRSK